VYDVLPDLREELGQRPWFLSAEAVWDSSRRRLVIVVEREGQSPEVGGPDVRGAVDEVRDCVIACLDFEADGIQFVVESSCSV
jgi:hypothetical protein